MPKNKTWETVNREQRLIEQWQARTRENSKKELRVERQIHNRLSDEAFRRNKLEYGHWRRSNKAKSKLSPEYNCFTSKTLNGRILIFFLKGLGKKLKSIK